MPSIRAYNQATALQPTDAFVIDRLGVGSMYVEQEDVEPGILNVAFENLSVNPPTSMQVISALIWPLQVTIPANFAGSYGAILTNPTASFVIQVQKNSVAIGTITIGTSGAYAFVTASAAIVTFDAGDKMTFVAPTTIDATAAGFFFTIIANPTGL